MNKLSQEELMLVYETAKKLQSISPSAIEKDIFITQAIHAIAEINHPQMNIVFCGGTCLAKAHKIIARMSEDIDFKIYAFTPFSSRSEQRKKLGLFRDEISILLKNIGFKLNEEHLRSRDNNSYTVFNLTFPSHFNQHQQLKPHIQLEFTLATPNQPTEKKMISRLVDMVFPEEFYTAKEINCISIIETAAEKWVALTRRIAAISRGHDPIDETLVRHLYDLQSIVLLSRLTPDFFTLALKTINQDQIKFKRHHEYRKNPLTEIRHAIKEINHDPKWKKYYNQFVEAMVFGKENASFEKCYEQLQQLTEQVISHPIAKNL